MDSRTLKFKKTSITVHFSEEVSENGLVLTTARTDFLRKSPGICTPLTVTTNCNSREDALQALIYKINNMIAEGTLVYEEHPYDPTTASIYKAEGVKPIMPGDTAPPLPVITRPLVSKPKYEGKPGQRVLILQNMEDGRSPYVHQHVIPPNRDFFTVPEIDIWGHGCDRESAEQAFKRQRRRALELVEEFAHGTYGSDQFVIYEYRCGSDSPVLSEGAYSKSGWDAHRKAVIFALSNKHEAEFYMLKCGADDPTRFREVLTLIYKRVETYLRDKSEIRPGDPEKELKEIQTLAQAYLASCSSTDPDKYKFQDPSPISDPKKARSIMELILRACMTTENRPPDPQLALDTIRTMAKESLEPAKPEPNPMLDILPKLIDCFKTITQDIKDDPEVKEIEGELSNCIKKAKEKIETPDPYTDAINHIMKTIEQSLDPHPQGANRPPAAILDEIIHDAAKALLTAGYYANAPTLRDHLDSIVRVMEARENQG